MSVTPIKQGQTTWLAALPPLVDGLTAVTLFLVLPGLSARLLQPSGWNAALLVTLYTFFCVGVYLIRKLLPQEGDGRWAPPVWFMTPKVRGVLALIFGLLMMTTIAFQVGYFASMLDVSVTTMGEGDSSALFLYAPGAWLGFSMLVILVLAFPVDANVPPHTTRYTVFAALGLLFCNGMLLLAAAQARAMVIAWSAVGGALAFVLVLVALTLSFLPARLLYQDKQPRLSGLLSFSLLLLLTAVLAVF